MKTRARVSTLLFAGLVAGSVAQAGTLARLTWLEGCWEAASPKRTIEGNRTAARGHTMIGVSRTVRGDSLSEYEFVVLREKGDRLTYEAHRAGR